MKFGVAAIRRRMRQPADLRKALSGGLFLLAAAAAAEPARPPMKIFLSQPGIYRMTHESLVAAGWPATGMESARLAMRHGTAPVPIWLEDGGDGRFGPGDAVLFAGDQSNCDPWS